MKIIIITLVVLFSSLNTYSQELVLSKAAINNFANSAYFQYRYGRGNLRANANMILQRQGYSIPDCAIVMENLKTDTKGREAFFSGIADRGGDATSLFNNFYSMDMTAKYANEVANYVYFKYRGGHN